MLSTASTVSIDESSRQLAELLKSTIYASVQVGFWLCLAVTLAAWVALLVLVAKIKRAAS